MIPFIVQVLLDLTLIGCLIYAVMVALRVERQMAILRTQRNEMERFVHEFGATVARAEAGIKALKQIARDSGDDLEKLIEKSNSMRDELKFVVDHADQLAERITGTAMHLRPAQEPETHAAQPQTLNIVSSNDLPDDDDAPAVRTKAERDLLRAIDKLR